MDILNDSFIAKLTAIKLHANCYRCMAFSALIGP